MLKAGFARVDITPPLGVSIKGYYKERICDGILDPLEINAVAFEESGKKAVLLSADNLGISQSYCDQIRKDIAAAVGCAPEAVYLACTHTHLAPGVGAIMGLGSAANAKDRQYETFFMQQAIAAAVKATEDLAAATLFYTKTEVEGVSFIRRYVMKDGSIRTNPGWQNPDIDHPLGDPDEQATLLLCKRDGKPEIAIAHFQTHPDVIGGTKVSADWPGFVRRTYEQRIPHSKCLCFVGAQGDTNHIDVRLTKAEGSGYHRARYMGEKIALLLIDAIPSAKPMNEPHLSYGQTTILADHNKGRPEELEEAIRIQKVYSETGDAQLAAAESSEHGLKPTPIVAKACRIVELIDAADSRPLRLSAIAIGDVAFAGVPGEPFTNIGLSIKKDAPFAVTLPTCNTNGKEGYFPTDFAESSYEARTSRFKADTAQRIIDGFHTLLHSL